MEINPVLKAAAAGYSSLVAHADLLDQINIFPVADSDTGTNLKISLAPLLRNDLSRQELLSLLSRTAIGNSGNIAATFFREFLQTDQPDELPTLAVAACNKARQAILDPRQGTMLDVFATLYQVLNRYSCLNEQGFLVLCEQLRAAVLATSELLPELESGDVVDAGALAMFIFFQGFFQSCSEYTGTLPTIAEQFRDKLILDPSWTAEPCVGFCISALLEIRLDRETASVMDDKTVTLLAELADSIVVSEDKTVGSAHPSFHLKEGSTDRAEELLPEQEQTNTKFVKVHLHTTRPEQIHTVLASQGNIVLWHSEDMAAQIRQTRSAKGTGIHIMTDAAGSLDRQTAAKYCISLLDSSIVINDHVRPESLCLPDHIYQSMRSGKRVSTAQASNFERYRQYAAAMERYQQVLYICVGSAFTGNYGAALAWKQNHDLLDEFHLLDSGAASGRLALIVLLTARFSQKTPSPDSADIIEYAQQCCQFCREYIFIDSLKYLVAGGRVSRAKGFFADLLHLKPVISPMPGGVAKIGSARSSDDQIQFAMKKLQDEAGIQPLILLQYSDNEQWIRDRVYPEIRLLLPGAEVIVTPLSLTSGVHMGPGTWAMAFAAQ